MRGIASEFGWDSKDGWIYRTTKILFFSVLVVVHAKEPQLVYFLHFKWRVFDELFWSIVNMEENATEPLSFRASGAFTAPATMIAQGHVPIGAWAKDDVDRAVREIMSVCQDASQGLVVQIGGLDDNLDVVESQFRLTGVDTANGIWRERLFTSILKGNWEDAQKIARDRINCHDLGGFEVHGQSFYQLADEYIARRGQ